VVILSVFLESVRGGALRGGAMASGQLCGRPPDGARSGFFFISFSFRYQVSTTDLLRSLGARRVKDAQPPTSDTLLHQTPTSDTLLHQTLPTLSAGGLFLQTFRISALGQ